jgi:predicted transposase/invertase (TIGR01784 family)
MDRYLNPKSDLAFKNVFGTNKNKEVLLAFLNEVFAGVHDKIEDVTFLKLDQNPEIKCLRPSIVDVLCKDTHGKQFIIEMQCAKEAHFIKRAVAYASRAYLNQREDEKDYKDMYEVVFLAILDHSLFPDKKAYLSHHKVSDLLTHEVDIKELSFTFLELGKFHKKRDELENNVERWIYFFKHAERTTPTELEDISKSYKVLKKAYDALSTAAYTKEELLDYDRYGMKEDEINTRVAEGKAEGLAEGLAEGEAKGVTKGKAEGEAKKARETALNLLSMGLSVEQIAKATGLTAEELKSLQQ